MPQLPIKYVGNGNFAFDWKTYDAARAIGNELNTVEQQIHSLKPDVRAAGLAISAAKSAEEMKRLESVHNTGHIALREARQHRNELRNMLGQNSNGQPLPGVFEDISLEELS